MAEFYFNAVKFQNTNPERGRKRRQQCNGVRSFRRNFRTRTPKGDGNNLPIGDRNRLDQISEHEPRKGTETVCRLFVLGGVCSHFRTRTPKGDGNYDDSEPSVVAERNFRTRTPKGDGNALLLRDSKLFPEFQNTNPERGRKLPPLYVVSSLLCRHFRTRTPKGDGNWLKKKVLIDGPVISEHEPRKGTETRTFSAE